MWPPHVPIFSESADKLAEMINTMSGGRLNIQTFGGGELVPPLQAFDAVSQGWFRWVMVPPTTGLENPRRLNFLQQSPLV